MTVTDNMNLRYCWYNLYVWIKSAQESIVNDNNISHRVVHINASDPTDFKFSEEETMVHVLGVVLIQKFSIKAGTK